MATRDMEAVSGSGESGNKEDQATSTTSTATASVSLLDRVKALKPSDLSRKQKIAVNLPHGKRLCKSINVATAAVTVKP